MSEILFYFLPDALDITRVKSDDAGADLILNLIQRIVVFRDSIL